MDKTLPRGIRNNNPLNIRIGNSWQGEVEHPTDTEFEQFVNMFYGCRAAFMLLRRYMLRYHLVTITDIISRWAPASENNTRRYIDAVVERSGFSAVKALDFYNAGEMLKLFQSMSLVECGCVIPYEVVTAAYNAVCSNR